MQYKWSVESAKGPAIYVVTGHSYPNTLPTKLQIRVAVYRKHHAEHTRAHNESVEIVLNPYPKVPSSVNSIYIVNILYRL